MALSSPSINIPSSTNSCLSYRLISFSIAPHKLRFAHHSKPKSKITAQQQHHSNIGAHETAQCQLRREELDHRKHATSTDHADDQTSYTSMSGNPHAYWDSHGQGLLQDSNAHSIATPRLFPANAIYEDKDDIEENALLLSAELRLLENAASDRAEMHSILAQQRDNWNKLFQRMLTSASLTACVLSGLAGHAVHSLSLSLPALLLNAGSAAMMAVINQFQPSQLAEEQRTAARLFRKLASDINYALHVSPHLRQNTPSFLYDCQRRLRALDKAFPMPLTPGGLEKFPSEVVPPVLIEPQLLMIMAGNTDQYSDVMYNGWHRKLTYDLESVAAMLSRSDIPKYTGWAQNLVKANKCLAIAAPCFAALAALLDVAIVSATVQPTHILGMSAAICSVMATFASSISNDMQLGMVFELYRNSAGYYADVETSIKETLRMPVEQRENGALFRQRIAYQLGRWPRTQGEAVVPADAKEAGTLF